MFLFDPLGQKSKIYYKTPQDNIIHTVLKNSLESTIAGTAEDRREVII